MDKAIDGLATPLEQLREEVMVSSPTKARQLHEVAIYVHVLCVYVLNWLLPHATKQSIKAAMDEAILAIESKLSARMDIRTKKV